MKCLIFLNITEATPFSEPNAAGMNRLVQAWAMNSNALRFWRRRQSPRQLRAGRRGGWAPPRFQPAARSPQRLAPPRDWGCVASEQGARRLRGSRAGTMGASCGPSARRLSPAACHAWETSNTAQPGAAPKGRALWGATEKTHQNRLTRRHRNGISRFRGLGTKKGGFGMTAKRYFFFWR